MRGVIFALALAGCGTHSTWTVDPTTSAVNAEWVSTAITIAYAVEHVVGQDDGGTIRVVPGPFQVPGAAALYMGLSPYPTPNDVTVAASRDGGVPLPPLQTAVAWEVCNFEIGRKTLVYDESQTPACVQAATALAATWGVK